MERLDEGVRSCPTVGKNGFCYLWTSINCGFKCLFECIEYVERCRYVFDKERNV